MPRLYCTQPLWRAFDPATRRSAPRPETPSLGAKLGDWVATLVVEEGTQYMLAMNIATRLTVVVEIKPLEELRARLAVMVSAALKAAGIMSAVVAKETAPLAHITFALLRDAAIREELEFTKGICEIEFMYNTDLLVIQSKVNLLPHGGIEGCLSDIAVRSLFASLDRKRPLRLVE